MTLLDLYKHFIAWIFSQPPTLRFYFLFGFFVELFPLVVIGLGLKKWKRLTLGTLFFIGFLIAEVLFNEYSNYYGFVSDQPNLALYYINSFLQSVFILATFWCFFQKRIERIITVLLWCLCLVLLRIDFLWVSGEGYNYLSQFSVNIIITGLSFYYFFTNFPRQDVSNQRFKETELIISAALVMQFFFKTINIFLEKFLLETQYNTILNIQTRNVNAFFSLLALLIYAYAFHKFKANEA